MKKYILGLILIIAISLYGCEGVDLSKVSDEDLARLSEKAIVCNEPYIRFGTSCCLDQNNNKICDRDERQLTEEEKEKEKDVNRETPVESTPPEKFLQEKCILAPGLACVSHKVEPTQTMLIISNGFGRTIRVTNLQVGECSALFDKKMVSGVEKTFTLTGCSNGVLKEAFKGDIKLTYEDTSYNTTKTVHGNLATKVESGDVAIEEPEVLSKAKFQSQLNIDNKIYKDIDEGTYFDLSIGNLDEVTLTCELEEYYNSNINEKNEFSLGVNGLKVYNMYIEPLYKGGKRIVQYIIFCSSKERDSTTEILDLEINYVEVE